jgi:mono/diheme cytochrome c family protein
MTLRRAALLLAVAFLSACRQQTSGVSESGKDIYMARCAVCHGDNGQGRPGMYPALAHSPFVDGPPERFAAIILDGLQGRVGNYDAVMPGWGAILRDTEIAAVMTWLRASDGKPPVTAVDINHTRVETNGRNTFWTAQDLQSLHAN